MKHNRLAGLVAGVVGGAAGGFLMELFQLLLERLSSSGRDWVDHSADSTHHPPTPGRQQEARSPRRGQSSTARMADRLAENATGQKLPPAQALLASELIHYGTAIGAGAIYGACRGRDRKNFLSGLGFGIVVFIGLNQELIPKLGLASPSSITRPRNRIYSLVAHILYGVSAEAVRDWLIRPAVSTVRQ